MESGTCGALTSAFQSKGTVSDPFSLTSMSCCKRGLCHPTETECTVSHSELDHVLASLTRKFARSLHREQERYIPSYQTLFIVNKQIHQILYLFNIMTFAMCSKFK